MHLTGGCSLPLLMDSRGVWWGSFGTRQQSLALLQETSSACRNLETSTWVKPEGGAVGSLCSLQGSRVGAADILEELLEKAADLEQNDPRKQQQQQQQQQRYKRLFFSLSDPKKKMDGWMDGWMVNLPSISDPCKMKLLKLALHTYHTHAHTRAHTHTH